MDLFQLILAVLAVVTPVAGGVVYVMKRYSDGRYLELESRLKLAEAIANSELEKVKAAAAQSLSASESIQSLTGTLVTLVDERRESTVATKENVAATKENVAALKTMSTAIDGMSKDRGDGMSLLTTAVTGLTNTVTDILPLLVKAVKENTEIMQTVASGQDELEDLFRQLALVVNRFAKQCNYDNRRFAEYFLRPNDASKQGIEDIASGKPDEAAAPAVTVTA